MRVDDLHSHSRDACRDMLIGVCGYCSPGVVAPAVVSGLVLARCLFSFSMSYFGPNVTSVQ